MISSVFLLINQTKFSFWFIVFFIYWLRHNHFLSLSLIWCFLYWELNRQRGWKRNPVCIREKKRESIVCLCVYERETGCVWVWVKENCKGFNVVKSSKAISNLIKKTIMVEHILQNHIYTQLMEVKKIKIITTTSPPPNTQYPPPPTSKFPLINVICISSYEMKLNLFSFVDFKTINSLIFWIKLNSSITNSTEFHLNVYRIKNPNWKKKVCFLYEKSQKLLQIEKHCMMILKWKLFVFHASWTVHVICSHIEDKFIFQKTHQTLKPIKNHVTLVVITTFFTSTHFFFFYPPYCKRENKSKHKKW